MKSCPFFPQQCQRLSIDATSLKYVLNFCRLSSEYSLLKNSLQIQPEQASFLIVPSFSQHLSKLTQNRQNSPYISDSKAFLIIVAAQLGCCKMKLFISEMETFDLAWTFFKSSIQLKNNSPLLVLFSEKKNVIIKFSS